MLHEYTQDTRLPLDYTYQLSFPASFDIPLRCSTIIKLYFGYVKLLDVRAMHYDKLDISMPLHSVPEKYYIFLDDNPEKLKYDKHKEACQHLLYLVMTSVTRNTELITEFLKSSRLYDIELISDNWITKQIEDYTDPRTINYTLKIMLLANKFEIIPNSKYRLDYTTVHKKLTRVAKEMGREITSKRQLTRGLNKLIKKEKGKTCIVKSRQFGKATRHIGIEGVFPTFFYKEIPSPSEIRQRAKLIR